MQDDAFTSPQADSARSPLQALAAIASPAAWRAAEHAPVATSLIVVMAVAAVLEFSLGGYRAADMYLSGRGIGAAYDAAYDPIVIDHGQVSVLGPRAPRMITPEQAFLVDPDETVSIDSITSDEFIVVRRDTIVRSKPMGTVETIPVSTLQDALGVDPLRIDGANLTAFWSGWGLVLAGGVFFTIGLVGTGVDVVTSVAYSACASFLLGPVAPAMSAGGPFRVALAASTATLLPGMVLNALGLHAPCCANLVVWPLVIAGLAALAVWRPRSATS